MKFLLILPLVSLIHAFPQAPSDPQLVDPAVALPQPAPQAPGEAQANQWWRHGGNHGGNGNAHRHRGNRQRGPERDPGAPDQEDVQTQYKHKIMHLFKAFAPKEAVERWFNISKDDRTCISNAQKSLGILWLGGSPLVKDETSWFNQLEESCPGAKDELDSWHQACLQHRAENQAKWETKFNALPVSVQNVFKKFNESFNQLRTSGAFLTRNTEAIKAAFLPVVQQLLAVSQDDWDRVVDSYNKTAVIFSADGELHDPFFTLVNGAEEYLRTGSNANQEELKQAVQAFKEYGQEKWAEYGQMLKDKVENAPEQEFSPEVEAEVENGINQSFDAAMQHAAAQHTSS